MSASQQGIEKHLLRSGPHIDDDFRSSNLNRLVRNYIKGHKVLDVGCGTGTLAMELVRRGHDVICQDPSQALTDLCRLMFAKWNAGPVQVLRRSAEEISETNVYDTVLLLDVLEHTENDRRVLHNIFQSIKPGGQLVLTVPAFAFLFGPRDLELGHYRRYDRRVLTDLLSESGFKLSLVRYWNLVGLVSTFLASKVLRRRLPEDFRYQGRNRIQKSMSDVLKLWFRGVENTIRFPVGLTLIVTADKPS